MASVGNDKQHDIAHAVLERSHSGSRTDEPTFDSVIAPVKDELAAVLDSVGSALSSEVATADAVSKYVGITRGKGVRPALVLLSARMWNPVTTNVRDAALGIELLQTSTLLHDDVIDDAATRRGSPSVNAAWGNGVAVLMGDILFIKALELFLSTRSLPVMDIAAKRTREMIEGEILGRDLRTSPDFTEAAYFNVIRRKTGSLMSLAAELGPCMNNADDEQRRHMRRYGELIGTAFQIVDDVLDVVGDSNVVGKPTGQDIREGTVTLPLIRALANALPSNAEHIRLAIGAGIDTDDQWNSIKTFIDEHDGVAAATEEALALSEEAAREISFAPESECRASLLAMLDYTIRRPL